MTPVALISIANGSLTTRWELYCTITHKSTDGSNIDLKSLLPHQTTILNQMINNMKISLKSWNKATIFLLAPLMRIRKISIKLG